MPIAGLLEIRVYHPDDLDALISAFLTAIRVTASRDYTPAQIEAWAQADRQQWAQARLNRPTWVAAVNNAAIGFADLEPEGHLDMMFVHPDYQGRGIATALVRTIELAARAQGLERLFTEASLTARPFFEAKGFVVVAAQFVEKRGQTFRNYRMEKILK